MSNFVPKGERLLQAAVDYLESDLLPSLDGYHRFQLRVCVNALRVVEREMVRIQALEQAENLRLQALLGTDGSLEQLNGDLFDQLASGALPLDTPGLVEHLRATLRDALSINNPSWIDGAAPGATRLTG